MLIRDNKVPLTDDNANTLTKALGTHAGMAFWAGSGPAGKTCKDCTHHCLMVGKRAGSACAKFRQMCNGKIGPVVPGSAHACKYFEPNKT